MVRLPGPGGDYLGGLIDRFEALVARVLRGVASRAAQLLGATPVQVPAEAVSQDDLHVIRVFWQHHLDADLMPALATVYTDSAVATAKQLADLQQDIADLTAPDASDYLRAARNRLTGVGDELWHHARQELADGVAAGDSMTQLAARVQASVGVTEPRARVIARTEVVSAHNAASLAQARVLNDPSIVKEWTATMGPGGGCDLRTRPSHCAADGQRVRIGERFEVGTALLDFPGDPTGPPDTVINCRCSIVLDLDDEPAPMTAAFTEALHPRDGDGKFAKKPEGGLPEASPFGGMHPATESDRAAFRTKVGKAIPPGWADVYIADDLSSARLMVRGRDKKGRSQSMYSAEHTENQAAAKFVRVKQLVGHLDKLDHAVERDAAHDDSAAALLLIRRLGMRPGSDRNTGAKEQAHGATNLRTSHVKVAGDVVHLDFVGKKGVHIQLAVKDPLIASTVQDRLDRLGPDAPLFATDEAKTRAYMHSTGVPAAFLLKDLRTVHANVVALRAIAARGGAKPATKTEFRSWRKDVAVQVSNELGNTPALALSSYVNPTVFQNWVGDDSWV
jgi:DNA topoisomerase I